VKRRIAWPLACTFALLSGPAQASFLRLVPTVTLEAEPGETGSLRMHGAIRNEGDEAAQGVQLESAGGGEVLADLGVLGAGESKPVEVTVEAGRFGIREPGSYQIAFRLLYRDANGVPFSAVFLSPFQRTSPDERFGMSAPVALVVDPEHGPGARLEVADRREFEVEVRNLIDEPVTTELRFVASKELRIQVPSGSRVELQPSESRRVRAELVNDRGLPNSSYATFALAEGVHQGRHFAEYTGFGVAITSASAERSRYTPGLLLGLALAFVVGGVAYWARTRRTA
jgi:hypothetical protein